MVVRELLNLIGFEVDESQMKKANSKVKGFVGGLAKGFGILTGVVTAVGGLALKSAIDIESLNAEFEVMLGSADKARKFTEDLQKMADFTPFDDKALAKNARTLLAFGVSQEKIFPSLQMLGDVAGRDAEKLSSLTLAFSQVSSGGKLTGQDLLQFINAGFNPLSVLAEKTGKSMSELKDEMSKGAISADMVAEAFKIATSEGGQFFGNMEKQSQTLGGLISTLVSKFNRMLAKVGMALIEPAKIVVKQLTDLIENELLTIVDDLVVGFAPLIDGIISLFISLMKFVTPFVSQLVDMLMPAINLIVAEVLILADLLIGTLGKIMPLVMNIISRDIAVLSEIFKILADLVNVLWQTALEPLLVVLFEIADLVNEILFDAIMDLVPLLEELSLLIIDLFQGLAPALKSTVVIIGVIIKLIVRWIGFVVRLFTVMIGKGLAIVIRLIRWIIELLGVVLYPLINGILWLFEQIALVIDKISKWIVDGIIWALNWVLNIIGKVIDLFDKIPGIDLRKTEPITTDKLMKDITKSNQLSSNNSNVNMNNRINITGAGSDTSGMLTAINKGARAIFQAEIQKILIQSGV